MALDLTPNALVTVARLKAHLTRTSLGETDITDRCVSAINAAVSWMEVRTRRALAARNWRTEFSVTCNVNATSTTFTPGSLGVKRGDDIIDMDTGFVPPGCRVLSVDSDTNDFVTSLATTNTIQLTSWPFTFGSEPIVCDGDSTRLLDSPEWPLVELFAAYVVDSNGTRTALNITDARIHRASGRIELPNDVFPAGEMNIELECRAGYEQPSTTRRGDWTDWSALERICLRAAEVFFTDDLNARGRMSDINVGGMSARVQEFAMPDDIESAIQRYVRTR